MIRWCSYCQKFLGEAEPYDDYSFTHGICASCVRDDRMADTAAIARMRERSEFFARLAVSGQGGDARARALLEEAAALAIRPLDLLMGFIQPALYAMGDRWARGEGRVSEEHNLTATCESMLRVLLFQQADLASYFDSHQPEVLLVNAEENYHTLGVQVVQHFLAAHRVRTLAYYPGLPNEDVVGLVRRLRPRVLGVSCALAAQVPPAAALAAQIAALALEERPVVVLGGRALHQRVALPPEVRVSTGLEDFLSIVRG